MPITYKPEKYALYTQGDSLTEQEHKDSCDINKMVRNAARGIPVRSGDEPIYGYDDLTIDAVQHRIQREEVEQDLQKLAQENEFEENEFDAIPKSIREKFGFKKKTKATKDNAKNDDKTTNNAPNPEPQAQPNPNPSPNPSPKAPG